MIRIDLKPLLFPMLRGVPMPAIAILVGLVAGRVRQRLSQNGDLREPAWGP